MAGIKFKSEEDLKVMRPACVVAAQVLDDIAGFIRPGVTTRQIDNFAAERIKGYGAKSAFLGYRKFPCYTCLSVNEEVVHGLATERELKFGDIVSADVGVRYNDCSVTSSSRCAFTLQPPTDTVRAVSPIKPL